MINGGLDRDGSSPPPTRCGTIPNVPGDFGVLTRPLIEPLLEPGETLRGVAAAVHQKTFSGQLYALGVTERRLILQPVDRHMAAKGDARPIAPEALESAKLDGAGGGWWSVPDSILDASALTLELRIRGGDKLKLMMMKGGTGMFAGLSGGESQQQGVLALADWMRTYFLPR
jgi:hypothetical protein